MKLGTYYFTAQRLTAALFVVLGVWFVVNLKYNGFINLPNLVNWLDRFFVLFLLFIMVAYYHAYLALKLIFEDYIPIQPTQRWLIKGTAWLLGMAAGISTIFTLILRQ